MNPFLAALKGLLVGGGITLFILVVVTSIVGTCTRTVQAHESKQVQDVRPTNDRTIPGVNLQPYLGEDPAIAQTEELIDRIEQLQEKVDDEQRALDQAECHRKQELYKYIIEQFEEREDAEYWAEVIDSYKELLEMECI